MYKLILIICFFCLSYSQDRILLKNNELIDVYINEVTQWGLVTNKEPINFKIIKQITTSNQQIISQLKQVIPNADIKSISNESQITFTTDDIPDIDIRDKTVIDHFSIALNQKFSSNFKPVEFQFNSYSIFYENMTMQIAFARDNFFSEKDSGGYFSIGMGFQLNKLNQLSFMLRLNHKSIENMQSGEYVSLESAARIGAYDFFNLLIGLSYNFDKQTFGKMSEPIFLNVGFEFNIK